MILERDGKFYKKVEREEEISEIEYLRMKVAELEERISQRPIVTVYPYYPILSEPNPPFEITYTT